MAKSLLETRDEAIPIQSGHAKWPALPNLLYRAIRFFVRKTFAFWERLGLHLTMVHFYEPIPYTQDLGESVWTPPRDLPGIQMNETSQIALLKQFSSQCRQAWLGFPQYPARGANQFSLGNGYFDSVDAEILFGFIRHYKPRRLYEIGSGFSTLLAAQAIRENQKEDTSYACEHVAIDPFPPQFLSNGGNNIFLLPMKVQDVPLSTFSKLQANDVLFVDSSHVLKIGSDVRHEYLDILPRLQPGVLVHFHDIFFPGEYPREWVLGLHRFWNEQYLLQAFLAFNSEFGVLWAGSYMHLRHPDVLAEAIPSYKREKCHPKSFWIQRKL